jgi:hypothetical protein
VGTVALGVLHHIGVVLTNEETVAPLDYNRVSIGRNSQNIVVVSRHDYKRA